MHIIPLIELGDLDREPQTLFLIAATSSYMVPTTVGVVGRGMPLNLMFP